MPDKILTIDKEKLRKRFWSKVDVGGPDECWEWRGTRFLSGYGRIKVDGKTLRAHRAAYYLFNGPIPDGLCVCHTCDNPGCVNPAHLWVGTNADNTADRHAKGRSARGERNGESKLTEEQVIDIRMDKRAGPVIASEYGISNVLVGHIKNGHSWVWLSGPTVRINHCHKLTPEIALCIIEDSGTQCEIAAKFGVSQTLVSTLKRGIYPAYIRTSLVPRDGAHASQ